MRAFFQVEKLNVKQIDFSRVVCSVSDRSLETKGIYPLSLAFCSAP